MIPISDLRPGNLIKTEYGILRVHLTAFNDVMVEGKDGRILWAKEIEGVEITELALCNYGFKQIENTNKFTVHNELFIETERNFLMIGPYIISRCEYLHELQNVIYWSARKELELNSDKNMTGFDILIDSMKRTGQSYTKVMNDIKNQFGIE